MSKIRQYIQANANDVIRWVNTSSAKENLQAKRCQRQQVCF